MYAPKSRRVHSGSRGFTRAPWRCWVQLGSRGFTLARLRVDGFIGVRLGSLRRVSKSPGLLVYGRVHSSEPRGRRVHWSSRGFTQALVAIVVFIRVRVGSLRRA